MRLPLICATALIAAVSTASSEAAVVLAKYTFAESSANVNNPTAAQTAPSTEAGFVNATSISKGSGISLTSPSSTTVPGGYNLFSGNGGFPNTALAIRDTQVADEAAAISGSKFVEFSVTPQTGYKLDLSTIVFDWARGGTAAVRAFSVRSSTDSFATSTLLGTQSTPDGTAATWSIGQTYNINLADITNTTVFRFYVWTPSANNQDVRFDNITINGQVSLIPEPTVMGLLGLTSLALLPRQRRNA